MKTSIIAEVGINHGGSFLKAMELTTAAIDAGADIIKYQVFNNFPDLKRYSLTKGQYKDLFKYVVRERMKLCFATAFDEDAFKFLSPLQNIWKIPSGFIANLAYYDLVKKYLRQNIDLIIISTGMSTMKEVEEAVSYFPRQQIVVMQCTSLYPTPLIDVNLRGLITMGTSLGVATGLSYHGHNQTVPVAAAALGAFAVEVHITDDRTREGGDHKASMDVAEFATMVKGVRDVEVAMGTGQKHVTEREKKFQQPIRQRMMEAIDL